LVNSEMQIEQLLLKLHDKKYCVLVGNGTTALYLSLKCHGLNKKNVGFQDNVCPHVLLAVLLSGAKPIFLNANKSGIGIDTGSINSKLHCIISIHSFGIPSNIDEVESYCKNNKVLLIEDAALGQGGVVGSKPIGSFGDLSILSFGTGKTVDIGHGGAILTNSKRKYEKLLLLLKDLPNFKNINLNRTSRFNYLHTKYYNDYFLLHKYSRLKKYFKKLIHQYGYYFLYSFDRAYQEMLYQNIKMINQNIRIRRDNHRFLENIFSDHNFDFIKICDGAVPWRFNLFVKNRNKILISLLKENIKISSWYPNLGFFFDEKLGRNRTIIEDRISKNILNIWINEEIDKKYLQNISNKIIQLSDNYSNAEYC
tara:strand:- start:8698 stop:9798 length:1101 start_codon:yes stop_codon:yes gene_type:complete